MTQISILQLKILILDCLNAESELADFLTDCARKYLPIITEEEAERCTSLMQRVSHAVDRITNAMDLPSDERLQGDSSDDKVPPPAARYCQVSVGSLPL